MLRGALRIGVAKNDIIHIFPKGCFGCLIFSMVVSSFRAKKQDLGL